jgi:hypothetical protein
VRARPLPGRRGRAGQDVLRPSRKEPLADRRQYKNAEKVPSSSRIRRPLAMAGLASRQHPTYCGGGARVRDGSNDPLSLLEAAVRCFLAQAPSPGARSLVLSDPLRQRRGRSEMAGDGTQHFGMAGRIAGRVWRCTIPGTRPATRAGRPVVAQEQVRPGPRLPAATTTNAPPPPCGRRHSAGRSGRAGTGSWATSTPRPPGGCTRRFSPGRRSSCTRWGGGGAAGALAYRVPRRGQGCARASGSGRAAADLYDGFRPRRRYGSFGTRGANFRQVWEKYSASILEQCIGPVGARGPDALARSCLPVGRPPGSRTTDGCPALFPARLAPPSTGPVPADGLRLRRSLLRPAVRATAAGAKRRSPNPTRARGEANGEDRASATAPLGRPACPACCAPSRKQFAGVRKPRGRRRRLSATTATAAGSAQGRAALGSSCSTAGTRRRSALPRMHRPRRCSGA